jgi:hypothetical protein
MDIKTRKTIIFNVAMLAIVGLVRNIDSFKSGPCTPNLDVLLPLLFFVISLFLTIRAFILAVLDMRSINLFLIYLAGFLLLILSAR